MKKQNYERPALTVVTVRAERGYAASISETVDAVNAELNRWAREADMEVIGTVSDEGLWRENQDISGVGTEGNGMAAGYFGTGSTEGWF